MASPAPHAVTSHNDISCVTSGEVLVFRVFVIGDRGERRYLQPERLPSHRKPRSPPARDKSLFVASRISVSVLLAVALTSASLAQDAGVSGIPPGAGEWVELQKPFLQCSAGAADPAAHNQARNTTDHRLSTQ